MSNIVLSKDLVNPFIELQKQRREFEKQQRELVSSIHHHCYTREDPKMKFPIYYEIVAVNLVTFSVLMKSFTIVLETSVQRSAKYRMEFCMEECSLDEFISAQDAEISRELYYSMEKTYADSCDIWYGTRGFNYKTDWKYSADWIW